METCLSCGDPLGSSTGLCYSCESSGAELPDVDEEVVQRVERYFIIASLKCPGCGELHTTFDYHGKTYTTEDFAIDSEEEWELEMKKEEDWVSENQADVKRAVLRLEREWPRSVEMLRRSHL